MNIPKEYADLLISWIPVAARQRQIAHHPGNEFTPEDDTTRGAALKRGTLPAVPKLELGGAIGEALAGLMDDPMYKDQHDTLLLPHLSVLLEMPVGTPWRTTYCVTAPLQMRGGATYPSLRRLLFRYHVPGVVVQGEVIGTRKETWENIVLPVVALYWPEHAAGYGVEVNAKTPVQVRDPRDNSITWYTPIVWTVCTTNEEVPQAPPNARPDTNLISKPGQLQRMMPQGSQGGHRG